MTHQEHHPDPEFVARLEDQLAQVFRHRERLGRAAIFARGFSPSVLRSPDSCSVRGV
jgi:hypothetical protein